MSTSTLPIVPIRPLEQINTSPNIRVPPLPQPPGPTQITKSLAHNYLEDYAPTSPSSPAQSTMNSSPDETLLSIDAHFPPPLPDPFAEAERVTRIAKLGAECEAEFGAELETIRVRMAAERKAKFELEAAQASPTGLQPPLVQNVGYLRSTQETGSAQGVTAGGAVSYGIDTGDTLPPRSDSPEIIMDWQPPTYPDDATVSPSEGIPMDCGMLPSRLHPPGQGSSRRRILSPQGPEQGKVGSGNGQTGIRWTVPFSADSRSNNAYRQGRTANGAYNDTHGFETHEVSSHISPPSPISSSSSYDSHLHSPANPHHAPTKPPPPQEDRSFNAHGWVEHLLPDESLYYVHPGYQVVADMDLEDEKLLDTVMTYLQNHSDVMPPGKELWLRDAESREGGFIPLRWVDHLKQSVVSDSSHEASGDDHHHPQYRRRDDRLDAKYRYWSFMESHPAHTSLPPDAHQDAMDALHWASTNEPIRSGRSTPPPFTREECQSFAALLQSIRKRGETPLRTHTVSKILLRVVRWRQSHFRPDKPLPVDAGHDRLRQRDHPIPVRSASAFILTIVVYACLAVAIFMCPAQSLVKISGIGGILFSLSPIISNIVAVVQSKVDNGFTVPYAGRDASMFSRKDDTITNSEPPAPPPWHIWLRQELESSLRKALVPGPPDVIPPIVAHDVQR
ncbi:hypothetical protein BD779DRAFT_1672962 [Infundibulicybe gibba]|nr:hypothetical protein BD779DRAFT_1672962 [Infundibulicybe gibba]